MPDTYVIHWADPARRRDGLRAIIGDEAACIREIMAGDEFLANEVTKIERYNADPDDGSAEVVSLQEVAQTIARLAGINQDEGGDITSEVYDFIHDHAGSAYARGLRIRGSVYEAA